MERKTFPELSHNGPVCLKRYHLCHGSVREKSTTPMFLDVIKGILFFMCSVDFQTPPPPLSILFLETQRSWAFIAHPFLSAFFSRLITAL